MVKIVQTVQKIPDGYRALAEGAVWQQRVADAWGALGCQTKIGWGHDEADVILLEDAELNTVDSHTGEPYPQERYMDGFFISGVVSVKTFTLVPSAQRYGANGEIAFASSRTIKRKDVLPELEFGEAHSVDCVILTVINSRSGAAEHVKMYPFPIPRFCEAFDHYSTSSRLTATDPCKQLAGPFCYETSETTAILPGWRRLSPSSTVHYERPLQAESSIAKLFEEEAEPIEEEETPEQTEPPEDFVVDWSNPLAPNYFLNIKRRPS